MVLNAPDEKDLEEKVIRESFVTDDEYFQTILRNEFSSEFLKNIMIFLRECIKKVFKKY